MGYVMLEVLISYIDILSRKITADRAVLTSQMNLTLQWLLVFCLLYEVGKGKGSPYDNP
jgi:hypothetical protein